jgi:hypothetical protein
MSGFTDYEGGDNFSVLSVLGTGADPFKDKLCINALPNRFRQA